MSNDALTQSNRDSAANEIRHCAKALKRQLDAYDDVETLLDQAQMLDHKAKGMKKLLGLSTAFPENIGHTLEDRRDNLRKRVDRLYALADQIDNTDLSDDAEEALWEMAVSYERTNL